MLFRSMLEPPTLCLTKLHIRGEPENSFTKAIQKDQHRELQMIPWYDLPVDYMPPELCSRKPHIRKECEKAVRAVFLRYYAETRGIAGAIVKNSWHSSTSEKQEHVTFYWVDKYSTHIYFPHLEHALRADIEFAYGPAPRWRSGKGRW